MKHDAQEMMPLFRRKALYFECTRCGDCCIGVEDEHVFLRAGEVRRLADAMGVTRATFRRAWTTRADDDLVLRKRPDGTCILLSAERACMAYEARPVQCRTYPFWDGILKTAGAWRREATRCEGIGRGARVAVEEVESALRAMR